MQTINLAVNIVPYLSSVSFYCFSIKVGDKVRMSSFIPEPSRGWAGVNGSSIGTVKSIDGTKGSEEIIVRFPECKEWMGSESELELSKTPAVGEKVQVQLKKLFFYSKIYMIIVNRESTFVIQVNREEPISVQVQLHLCNFSVLALFT